LTIQCSTTFSTTTTRANPLNAANAGTTSATGDNTRTAAAADSRVRDTVRNIRHRVYPNGARYNAHPPNNRPADPAASRTPGCPITCANPTATAMTAPMNDRCP